MPHPDLDTSAARCWTLCSADGAVDVEVVAGDDEPLARVLPALALALGVPVPGLWSGSSRLPDDALLGSPDLRHGVVLGLGRPGPRTAAAERPSALELHVVGGPEAGRTEPLALGRHVVGRGAEASLGLDDADVSRRHLQISVNSGGIAVHDLGSTNGSRLDGAPLGSAPRAWPDGAVLRAGSSSLAVRGPDGWPAAVEAGAGGRLRLRPSARRIAPRPEVVVEFPRAPEAPPRRRLAWLAVALPAVAGIVMATWMHAPQFLFFALLSPVVAVGTWASDRWSGRRQGRRSVAAHVAAVGEAEQRLADAVRADRRAAQERRPDLASLATVARRRTARLWERRRADPDALEVRLGTGPGTGSVVRVAGNGTRLPEPVDDLPVVADLREGGLAVVGPLSRTAGVLSAVLAQLAVLHGPDELQLVLVTRPDGLATWRWLRWLPHLHRTDVSAADRTTADADLLRWLTAEIAARTAAADGGTSGRGASALPWLVVVVDRDVDARVAAVLGAARAIGVVALTAAGSSADLPVPVEAVFELGGETGDRGVLRRPGFPEQRVVVDRLPRQVAADLARDLAALRPAGASTALPTTARLLDLPDVGLRVDDRGRVSGRWSRSRDALVATLGRGRDGPLRVDLCRQGPHALVAGTTGAGKSELLQTLIAGLALAHPPDRCSFLLVDYKGGAAFGEAVGLPHTVGLLTDLDGAATERALRSLGAELTRREHLLAAHAATDIAGLPASVGLARLVIVVDEFATLAEEHPAFVPGLVGIAQRGRSLGVHLVLATQRPGGVVSPEIRANCSLRICLRTTDESDSRDVLGAGLAAFLPVDLPGRGFLRVGTAPPVELQVARVSAPAPVAQAGPTARRWSWPAAGPPHDQDRTAGPSDLAVVAAALRSHARDAGTPAPHRPWLAPLPVALAADDLADTGPGPGPVPGTLLRIGLVDRPDAQVQSPLELDLADGGGWLAVGGPRSGRTTLLRTVLAEAVARRAPAELHVHVLDHGGGGLAAEARAVPHTGTAVGVDDALRTTRLVDRLAQEVTRRRAEAPTGPWPALLLLVDGVESLSGQLDEADPAGGSAALLRLIRDGAAVGLTSVVTADRATPGGRLAAVAATRLLLPLPDRADYAVAGIPARRVPEFRPPGRALLGDSGLECQLALPRQLRPRSSAAARSGALHIAELPPDPVLPSPGPQDGAGPLVLPIGPGGDEGTVLSVDLSRTGGLLVVGPPGSGRSTCLTAFAAGLAAAGIGVLAVSGSRSPATAAQELTAWLDRLGGSPGVVVADDAAAFAETTALVGLPAPGAGVPVAVVAAGTAADLARLYQGPVAALRRQRTAVVLTPGPGDGELLGIRLPRAPVPSRPGSGWLVTGGTVQRVQVARRRGGAIRADQSSSSAGPISCVAYQASS